MTDALTRQLSARLDGLRHGYLSQILTLVDDVTRDAGAAGSNRVCPGNDDLELGGKHLHALLPLLVAEALGEDPARLVPFGAACEMLHSAALVADEDRTSGHLSLALAGAARCCGADPGLVARLEAAAAHLGVLVRLRDDVVDLYGGGAVDARAGQIGEGKRSPLVMHALQHAPAADAVRLQEILEGGRDSTEPAEIEEAKAIFARAGSLAFVQSEMRCRAERAARLARLDSAPELRELIAALGELILEPVRGVRVTEGAPTGVEIDAADRAFGAALLPKVSRTFALSIEALPGDLREAVRVAYLACRILDTIEDEPRLPGGARASLFDAFDDLLADDRASAHDFEQIADALIAEAPAAEKELCRGAGSVFRVFRALAPSQRDAIRPYLQEMSRGMREYAERADGAGGRLRLCDLDDLERYCYFVAGTVGHLLTALFEQTVPALSAETRAELSARAVSFGIGLQLVNIVKDVAVDHARGDCFLPQSLAAEHGVSLERLLDASEQQGALAMVRAVCARARVHLQRAEAYTALWPEGDGEAVRLFCAVPLALALATLREVEAGHDTLQPDRTPKVSREVVARVLGEAQRAVARNDRLARMFHQLV